MQKIEMIGGINLNQKLSKRFCGISMKIELSGLTHIYLDIGGQHLCLMVSSVLGHRFNDLLRALYHLSSLNANIEDSDDLIDYKYGICAKIGDNYEVIRIIDEINGQHMPLIACDIPWKAAFTWDEEGSTVNWLLEREPTEDTDFTLTVHIEICRLETESYSFRVRYKDFCYAVTKACTEVIKQYGLYGYYRSNYSEDINIRYLLFLKSVALDNFAARELTELEDNQGKYSSLEKEIELLLFNM